MAEKLDLEAKKISEGPTLSDMPIGVIHEIVDNLEGMKRLVLRKVCRKLRDFMDNKDPGIRKISVEVSEEPPHCLDIDDCCISYDISGDGCTVQAFGGSNKYIEKVPLIGILDDLAVILKNPKLRLNLLEVSAFEEQRAILKAFGEISSMLHTKRITLEGFEPCDFISMLSYFKPGILGEINIENLSNFTDTTQVCDLFELEQWKQAKSISIISKKHFNFPIEHLFHLSRFQVNWMRLSVDDAIKIRDVIMKSSHLNLE